MSSDIGIGAIRIRLGALKDDVSSGLGGNISRQFSVSLQTFPRHISVPSVYLFLLSSMLLIAMWLSSEWFKLR